MVEKNLSYSAPHRENIQKVLNPDMCCCTASKRRLLIQNIPFLKGASNQTLEAFYQNIQSCGMQEDAEISTLKVQKGFFGIVASGAFKVYRYVKDGQLVIFDILTAGDFFHFGQTEAPGTFMFSYPDQIQTMTTSCLLSMESSRLEAILLKEPKIFPAYIQALTARITQAHERFIHFTAFQAEHRLAYLVRFLHDKGPGSKDLPGLIPFHITRKDLAAMAGLTLETVSRVLSHWEKEGFIKSGRGWVELLNEEALENLAKIEEI